ncbi:MAG: class I adenylate-forming enzyme family protein [Rhodospirillaceae bacterium]|nr:class I adenylate-forming enzyme family protein [Rhodospirillaceae bacterium]
MTPFLPDVIERYRALGAWGDETVWQRFIANCQAMPERDAVIDDPRRPTFTVGTPKRLTYRDLAEAADRLAAVLVSDGFEKDDVIVVQLPNVAEQIELYLAAAKLGLVISPIPIQYRHKEIADVLEISGATACFTTSNFKGFDHVEFFLTRPSGPPVRVYAWGCSRNPGAIDLEARLAERAQGQEGESVKAAQVSPDEIFSICWTSGTEAKPKGVPRTHNNWMTTGKGIVAGGRLRDGCRLLNPFPTVNMASIGGIWMPWLITCGTFVLHHPFDLDGFLDQLKSEHINYTVVAPALLNRIARDKKLLASLDLGELDGIGTGSAPPDAWMMRVFERELNVTVTNFFGSNEGVSLTSGIDDVADPEARARFFPRAGHSRFAWRNPAMNWSETKLLNVETGKEIDEPGRVGELIIRGPSVFPGYFRRGTVIRDVFDDEGYYSSGDLFEIAEDASGPRYYRFVGRKREMIIRGGMNISPLELDSLLSKHPLLKDAAVAGYPDDRLGERVCAYVVPEEGAEISLESLAEFLTEQGLAQYKFPERLQILEALPRSPLNKIVRRKLTSTSTK